MGERGSSEGGGFLGILGNEGGCSLHDEARRLRHVVRRMVQALGIPGRDEVCCHGVTLAQCHVLVEVCEARGLSLSDLAERLRLDKSTVSRTVETLVGRNLLTRTSRREDRRCVAIEPTVSGEELCDVLRQEVEASYGRILSRIPEEKREMVLEAFELFLEAVADLPEKSSPETVCFPASKP